MNDDEEYILVSGKIHIDICRIIPLIINDIQKELDISGYLIDNIFKTEIFINNINFVQKQLYYEMVNDKNNREFIKSPEFINSLKLCKFKIKKYNNGVVDFCNKDKLLHENLDHEYLNDYDYNEYCEQYRKIYIVNKFHDYLNLLYLSVYDILMYYIYLNTKKDFFSIYNIDKINSYYYKSEFNNTIFKEKKIYPIKLIPHINVYSKLTF